MPLAFPLLTSPSNRIVRIGRLEHLSRGFLSNLNRFHSTGPVKRPNQGIFGSPELLAGSVSVGDRHAPILPKCLRGHARPGGHLTTFVLVGVHEPDDPPDELWVVP